MWNKFGILHCCGLQLVRSELFPRLGHKAVCSPHCWQKLINNFVETNYIIVWVQCQKHPLAGSKLWIRRFQLNAFLKLFGDYANPDHLNSRQQFRRLTPCDCRCWFHWSIIMLNIGVCLFLSPIELIYNGLFGREAINFVKEVLLPYVEFKLSTQEKIFLRSPKSTERPTRIFLFTQYFLILIKCIFCSPLWWLGLICEFINTSHGMAGSLITCYTFCSIIRMCYITLPRIF